MRAWTSARAAALLLAAVALGTTGCADDAPQEPAAVSRSDAFCPALVQVRDAAAAVESLPNDGGRAAVVAAAAEVDAAVDEVEQAGGGPEDPAVQEVVRAQERLAAEVAALPPDVTVLEAHRRLVGALQQLYQSVAAAYRAGGCTSTE